MFAHRSRCDDFIKYLKIKYERTGFKWNDHQQNLLLGSFFWMFWVLQLPGGVLIANYGAKYILGSYNLIASLLCFATPLVSYLDFSLLVALRIAQGLFAGIWWNGSKISYFVDFYSRKFFSALYYFNDNWIPLNERSSFATAHFGSSFGAAVAYLIFGFILEANSWEWIFHFCGTLGILWYMLWNFTVSFIVAKLPIKFLMNILVPRFTNCRSTNDFDDKTNYKRTSNHPMESHSHIRPGLDKYHRSMWRIMESQHDTRSSANVLQSSSWLEH